MVNEHEKTDRSTAENAGENAAAVKAVRSLLLVDDEPNVLASLTRTLRPFGYQLLQAPSAMVALDILASHEVGVILSDFCMPEMSGIKFLTEVRARYPDTVRIILSGYADDDIMSGAMALNIVHAFVDKPWDRTELCQVLENAFEQYENPERIVPDRVVLADMKQALHGRPGE